MQDRTDTKRRWRGILVPLTIGMMVFLLFTGWSYAKYGSISNAVRKLNGHVLAIDSYQRELGVVYADVPTKAHFSVRNLTGRDVRIVGAKADCRCLVGNELPMTIKPFGMAQLEFALKPSKSMAGSFVAQTAELYVDPPSPPVVLTVSGTVAEDAGTLSENDAEESRAVSR